MLTCEEAARLLSESLERGLPLSSRLALWMHLLMCKYCSRFRRQALFLRETVHRLRNQIEQEDIHTPHTLPPETRQRIQRRLQNNLR